MPLRHPLNTFIPEIEEITTKMLWRSLKPEYVQGLQSLSIEWFDLQDHQTPEALLIWAQRALRFILYFHQYFGRYAFLIKPPEEILRAVANDSSNPAPALFIKGLKEAFESVVLDMVIGLMRKVMGCIYHLPLAFREAHADLINWDTETKWYQLEFFGALLVGDRKIAEYESRQYFFPAVGTSPVFEQFCQAYTDEAAFVKVAMLDALATDFHNLKIILGTMAKRLHDKTLPFPPARPLPAIKTLVTYFRELHALYFLLLVTPTFSNTASIPTGAVSSEDLLLDINKLTDTVFQKFPEGVRKKIKEIIKQSGPITRGQLSAYSKKMKPEDFEKIQKLLEFPGIQPGGYGKFLLDPEGNELTSANRHLLAGSVSDLEVHKLLYQCVILRRLQVVGEFLSNKFISPSLRKIAEYNWESLVLIRNGLTHQTQREWMPIVEALMQSPERLQTLWKELGEAKIMVRDLIQQWFLVLPTYPKINLKEGILVWGEPLTNYWESIKKRGDSSLAVKECLHENPLLESAEIDSFLATVNFGKAIILSADKGKRYRVGGIISPEAVENVLQGRRNWFSKKEESALLLGYDREDKASVKIYLEKADAKRKRLNKSKEEEKRLVKKQKEELCVNKFSEKMPGFSELATEFREKFKTDKPNVSIIMTYILKQRERLYELLSDFGISFLNKADFKQALLACMEENVFHQDAIEYLAGQIFLALFDLQEEQELKYNPVFSRQKEFLIQVRNYIEHRNPLFDTIEAPYRCLSVESRPYIVEAISILFNELYLPVAEMGWRLAIKESDYAFEEKPVPGDNHCLFHAIAKSINVLKGWKLDYRACRREAGERLFSASCTNQHTMQLTLEELCNRVLYEGYAGISVDSDLYKALHEFHEEDKRLAEAITAQSAYVDGLKRIFLDHRDAGIFKRDPESKAEAKRLWEKAKVELHSLKKQRDELIPNFSKNPIYHQAYCEAIVNTDTWGGSAELQALAEVLNIKIIVYSDTTADTDVPIIGIDGMSLKMIKQVTTINPGGADEIALLHTGLNHYHCLAKNPTYMAGASPTFFSVSKPPKQQYALPLPRL